MHCLFYRVGIRSFHEMVCRGRSISTADMKSLNIFIKRGDYLPKKQFEPVQLDGEKKMLVSFFTVHNKVQLHFPHMQF